MGLGDIVIRLGGFLAFFGFGSAVLHLTSVQFRLLIWAEPMQPWLGLGLGTLGVVVVVVKLVMNNENTPVPDGVPVAPQQQQFGPPPGGYAALPDVQRGQRFAPQQQGAPFPPQPFGQQPVPPAGQGYGPPAPAQPGALAPMQPGPPAPVQSGPPAKEPVLGRPQFAPQPINSQPGSPPRPPVPPAGPAQFPPRQQPPQQFGPQG